MVTLRKALSRDELDGNGVCIRYRRAASDMEFQDKGLNMSHLARDRFLG
jgi:hypothetical protein